MNLYVNAARNCVRTIQVNLLSILLSNSMLGGVVVIFKLQKSNHPRCDSCMVVNISISYYVFGLKFKTMYMRCNVIFCYLDIWGGTETPNLWWHFLGGKETKVLFFLGGRELSFNLHILWGTDTPVWLLKKHCHQTDKRDFYFDHKINITCWDAQPFIPLLY